VPLSEHEQRILEEIERSLAREDPDLADRVSRPFYGNLARRVRLAVLGLLVGFAMLVMFVLSPWWGVAGFVVMLLSGLVLYRDLKRVGTDQLQSWKAARRLSVTGLLGRMAERFGGRRDASS
jgi:hypothetical protein